MKFHFAQVTIILCLFFPFILSNSVLSFGDFEYGVAASTSVSITAPDPMQVNYWYSNHGPITVAGSGYQGITAHTGNNFLVVDDYMWQFVSSSGLANAVLDISFWYIAPQGMDIYFAWTSIDPSGADIEIHPTNLPQPTNTWTLYQTSIQLNNNPFNFPTFNTIIGTWNGAYLDGMTVQASCPLSNTDYTTPDTSYVFPTSMQYTVDISCVSPSNTFPAGVTFYDNLGAEIDLSTQNVIWYQIAATEYAAYTLHVDTCSSDFDTVLFALFYDPLTQLFFSPDFNDDGCETGSLLNLAVPDDMMVYIAAGGFNGAAGTIIMNINSNVNYVKSNDNLDIVAQDVENVRYDLDYLEVIMETGFFREYLYDQIIYAEINAASNIVDSFTTQITNQIYVSDTLVDTYTTSVDGSVDTLAQNLIQAVTTQTASVQTTLGGIDTKINDIASDVSSVDTTINNLWTQTVQTIIPSLVSTSGTATSLNSALTAINSQITQGFSTMQSNIVTKQIGYFLVQPAASVPSIYKSPDRFNGKLDTVKTTVQNAYTAQYNTATSHGATNFGTCNNDPVCAYFFKTAKPAYDAALASFTSNYNLANYAKSFTFLQTAYTSLYAI